KQGI
ncbi:hypothetical protein S40293_11606, partial [Stachybotrys chartarum IBT 40293]